MQCSTRKCRTLINSETGEVSSSYSEAFKRRTKWPCARAVGPDSVTDTVQANSAPADFLSLTNHYSLL